MSLEFLVVAPIFNWLLGKKDVPNPALQLLEIAADYTIHFFTIAAANNLVFAAAIHPGQFFGDRLHYDLQKLYCIHHYTLTGSPSNAFSSVSISNFFIFSTAFIKRSVFSLSLLACI